MATEIEKILLGSSGQLVSRIALGCEAFGGFDSGLVNESVLNSAVELALESGINLFDTAGVYGLGRSEKFLSRALSSERNNAVITTKAGFEWEEPSDGERAAVKLSGSAESIMESVKSSLIRLDIRNIPLLLIHWPDESVPISETMDALKSLHVQGLVDGVGYANASFEVVQEANSYLPLSAVQLRYNVVHRDLTATAAEYYRANDISVMAYGVLGQGLLTGKFSRNSRFDPTDRRSRLSNFVEPLLTRYLDAVSVLEQIAVERDKSIAQVAIRSVLDLGDVDIAVVGAKSSEQVAHNLGADGWKLSQQEISLLESSIEPIISAVPIKG